MTRKFPVPVYENEPSSIVAYTLRFALFWLKNLLIYNLVFV
jgi:hypothetical protein